MQNIDSSKNKMPRTCSKCNTVTTNQRDKFCIRCGTELPSIEEIAQKAVSQEQQKFCSECGETIVNEDDKFCTSCGKPIRTKSDEAEKTREKLKKEKKFCIYCGKPLINKPNIKFCKYCGKPIPGAQKDEVSNNEGEKMEQEKKKEDIATATNDPQEKAEEDSQGQIPEEEQKDPDDFKAVKETSEDIIDEDNQIEDTADEDANSDSEPDKVKPREIKSGLIPTRASTAGSYHIPNPYTYTDEEHKVERIPEAKKIYSEKNAENVPASDLEKSQQLESDYSETKQENQIEQETQIEEDSLEHEQQETSIMPPDLDDVEFADSSENEKIEASTSEVAMESQKSGIRSDEEDLEKNDNEIDGNEDFGSATTEKGSAKRSMELETIKVAICPRCERNCNVVGKTPIEEDEWNLICAIEILGEGKYLVECPGCGALFIVDIYMAYPAWEERL